MKILERLNFIIVILALVIVAVGSILVTYDKINVLQYSYYLIGIGVISLILYIINKIFNFKFSKFEFLMFGLIILTLLSLIGTVNYKDALWGRINRREGLFVILTYYVLALLTSNIKNKKQIKIIIGTVLTIGILNIAYGLMQTKWIEQSVLKIKNKKFYAAGFTGNSMNYAALLSICYPIILGLFVKEKEIKKTIFYFVLLVLFTFGTLISGSMAVLLSCGIIYVFIAVKNIITLIQI